MRHFGDDIPWPELRTGFPYRGRRVHVLGPEGIFKPAVLDLPLSITTAPPKAGKAASYHDSWDRQGLLLYRYRGTDPSHPDNRGLEVAMRRQLPLLYWLGVPPGRYMAAAPVHIVQADPASLTFTVAVEPAAVGLASMDGGDEIMDRRYATRLVRQRLHQADFRQRVLSAYRRSCAMCSLRHRELLDAAHIVGDGEAQGHPVVSNGLALCKLHHAAFDVHILGVRPDLVIDVRADILEEHDGPMLRHGLQQIRGQKLLVPSRADWKPSPDALEERYAAFRAAS